MNTIEKIHRRVPIAMDVNIQTMSLHTFESDDHTTPNHPVNES